MSTTEPRTLTGARWSLVCRTGCARAGLYGHQDAPCEEPSRQQLERFQLGHDLSNAHRDRDIIQLAAEGWECISEAEIPWPVNDAVGSGHADLLALRQDGGDVTEAAVVEYTTRSGAELDAHKALQATGYALNAGANAATVVSIDPASGHVEHYPIDVGRLAPRVRELEAATAEAIRSGQAERVCQHPGDGRSRLCPYVEHCFADWQPTPLDELIGLSEMVRRLADVEDDYRDTAKRTEALKTERAELRATLAEYVPANEDIIAARNDNGFIRLRRSVFTKQTFSLGDARKAGHELPDTLRAFEKTHEESRWTIRRVGA